MSSPTSGSWERLQRVVRYGLKLPRPVYHYPWQNDGSIEAYVDSDWAGCVLTRRSTSGGALLLGSHLVKHWSTTQAVLALSSTEAELYAIVKGASQALGLQSLTADLGWRSEITVHTDSSGTQGVCRRKGVGKLRQIEVGDLWVQDKTLKAAFALKKVACTENPADLLTKYVDASIITKATGTLQLWPEGGRASSVPAA